jgi:hypothetical protein
MNSIADSSDPVAGIALRGFYQGAFMLNYFRLRCYAGPPGVT